MSKQFISEAQRMQKLAGMPISEMALPEMARTAGTGGAYSITEKGEEILKQAKASGAAPEGIKNSELAALVFLYKAKKEGKRVQKIDYAKERNVPQPAVNPIFNSLEAKELVSKEGYTSKQQEPKSSRPRPDVDAMLGDLDIEEAEKSLNEDNWNKAINSLIYTYSAGNDNEYEPGYEHEFNVNVELDADDDLIPFYNFLKTQPKKNYTGYFKNIPVSVTANTEYEDEDLGDLIVKFTEPENWDPSNL